MQQRSTVHRLDPADRTVLSTSHPDGSVTGTADPALLRTIGEALANPVGEYDPRLRAIVPRPASRYDSQSWGQYGPGASSRFQRATYHIKYKRVYSE